MHRSQDIRRSPRPWAPTCRLGGPGLGLLAELEELDHAGQGVGRLRRVAPGA